MAQDVNRWIGIGRLTKDLGADERSFGYVANGQARANVSIAVNHSKKQGDEWVTETDFLTLQFGAKQQKTSNHILQKVHRFVLMATLNRTAGKKMVRSSVRFLL